MGDLRVNSRRRFLIAGLGVATAGTGLACVWDDWIEKRVAVVEPERIYRGAWQRPRPLLRLIAREKIRTVVTLTAINRDDPKYVDQEAVMRQAGVDWRIIPMHGSRATPDEMTEAADLIANPAHQPVFFHCVGGHHRSNLVHAAYRIRHCGASGQEAWDEVAALPWSRPDRDVEDHTRILAYASRLGPRKDAHDDATTHSLDDSHLRRDRDLARRLRRDSVGNG